jgi:hypothetical protein
MAQADRSSSLKVGIVCEPPIFTLSTMSLLELVIVVLIVYVLHGFIDLRSPWFPVAAVLLLVGAIGVALLLTRVVGNMVVHLLLGDEGGTPTRPRKYPSVHQAVRDHRDADAEIELKRALQEHPEDPIAAQWLAELYYKAGRYSDYIAERERYLEAVPNLRREEKCSIYHRLADLCLAKLHNPAKALLYLNSIILDFPQTKEAVDARKRMQVITEGLENRIPGDEEK